VIEVPTGGGPDIDEDEQDEEAMEWLEEHTTVLYGDRGITVVELF